MSKRDYLKHLGFATAAMIVTANQKKVMSNEPTISEMNITIARFMGMEGTDKFIILNYMYEQSWDLLMPVVKKIKSIHFDILRQRANIMDYMQAAAPMNSGLIEINIQKLHEGVYKFLSWYNKQKEINND